MLTNFFIQVSTSGLGNVEHGLLYELMRCASPSHGRQELGNTRIWGENVVQVLGGLESCWHTTFRLCREYKHRHTDAKYMNLHRGRNYLCGGWNTETSIQPLYYQFRVYSKYGMLFYFLEFNFPCLTRCAKAHMIIYINGNFRNNLKYCGKRAPWRIAFGTSIQGVRSSNLLWEDFNFIMEYTAIDRASPEMTKMKEIYVTFVPGDQRTIPIQYFPFHNDDNLSHDIVSYMFVSHVLDKVCIEFVPANHTQLYNGPGRKSEMVQIAWEYYGRQYLYCFQSFLGSAWLSSNAQDNIKWNTTNNTDQHGSCTKYYSLGKRHFSAQDNGNGAHCMWEIEEEPEEIHIEQVTFHGFNMFMFMTTAYYDKYSLYSYFFRICQYGGLYILYKHTREQWNHHEQRYVRGNAVTYLSLCTNVYNKPSIRLLHDVDIYATYLVFTTFQHYSSGSAEIVFLKSACKGYHYEFFNCHTGPSLGFGKIGKFPYYYKTGKLREFWNTTDTGIPSCKAIWLMTNVDGEGGIYDNCKIENSLRTLTDVFMVGPQDIHIHNWIIPLTHHLGNVKDTDHYNFNLTATVLKDFPVDMTEVQQTITVHHDQDEMAHLSHLRQLTFATNNSWQDLHATVIKIQLFQNLVCINKQSIHTIEANIPHLFVTSERGASRYIYVRSLEQSYCKQILASTPCATLNTSSLTDDTKTITTLIDQVYLYHSYGFTEERVETNINITMIDKQECLNYCALDISIWENLQYTFLHNSKLVRHFEWKKVKHLQWRVLPTNTEGGFRLCINRTCSVSCTHICEVTVKFAYHKSTVSCLTNTKLKTNPQKVSFGSWKDAFLYCKPKQLFSAYGNKGEHDFSDSMSCASPQNDVDFMDNAFFAGLHKLHKVIHSC